MESDPPDRWESEQDGASQGSLAANLGGGLGVC